MTTALSYITTPKQAVEAMVSAGALFTVRQRDDGLGLGFTYSVGPDGDLQLCRQILASVKSRPPQFLEAFKIAIQRLGQAATSEGGGR